MLQRAKLKEYKLKSLNMVLPKALDEIETNLEYLTYNMIFLKDCFEDFEKVFRELMELEQAARPTDSAEDIVARIQKVKSDLEFDSLAKEIPEAIKESLDGLRELLRSSAGIRGLVESQEKKGLIDLNEVLLNLTFALKRQWRPNANLHMSLDSNLCPVFGVKSDLHYALGRSLFHHMQLLRSLSKSTPCGKGILSIVTRAQDSHSEIRISSQIDSGLGETKACFVKDEWEEDLEFVRWIITSEHKGKFEVRKERFNKCETMMRLPFS